MMQFILCFIVHYLFLVYFVPNTVYWRVGVKVTKLGYTVSHVAHMIFRYFFECVVVFMYADVNFRRSCKDVFNKLVEILSVHCKYECSATTVHTSTKTTDEEVKACDSLTDKTFFSFETLVPDECTTLTRKDYEAGFVVLGKGKDFLVIEDFSSRHPVEPHLKAFFDMLNKKKDGRLSEEEYKAGFLLFDAKNTGEIDKSSFYRTLALKVPDEFYGPRIFHAVKNAPSTSQGT